MPELPEVETVCRGLRPILEGRRLALVEQRRADLRRPFPSDFVARTQGRRIERIERRAKFMLFRLDSEETLLLHLGMSGRMQVAADPTLPYDKHDHLVLTTEEGQQVRFNDARRFGSVDLFKNDEEPLQPSLATLGPEPLGNLFSGPVLAAALKGKNTPIKAALLDQSVVAGLGNIYVCEALYQAGISPRRKAASVQGLRAERLAAAVRDVLERAIAAGGSSLRDYVQADGELGYFQHAWAVYGREGERCRDCDCLRPEGIRRLVQSGRSTFFCPERQR